jgi:hypothetical protein
MKKMMNNCMLCLRLHLHWLLVSSSSSLFIMLLISFADREGWCFPPTITPEAYFRRQRFPSQFAIKTRENVPNLFQLLPVNFDIRFCLSKINAENTWKFQKTFQLFPTIKNLFIPISIVIARHLSKKTFFYRLPGETSLGNYYSFGLCWTLTMIFKPLNDFLGNQCSLYCLVFHSVSVLLFAPSLSSAVHEVRRIGNEFERFPPFNRLTLQHHGIWKRSERDLDFIA